MEEKKTKVNEDRRTLTLWWQLYLACVDRTPACFL